MNKIKTISLLILLVWGTSSILYAQNEKMDSVSYSLGALMASNLKKQGFTKVDATSLVKGINDVLNGDGPKMSLDECNAIVSAHMQEQSSKEHEGNMKEGADFLAKNATKEGVKVTDSGLQYEVMSEGTGKSPIASDRVTVHYHGTLIDGTVFDSSVERGEPATFGLSQVISGWTEGLQLMKEGAKYRFYLPYNLAYGDRSAGDKIKPFSTLVFEVELIKVD